MLQRFYKTELPKTCPSVVEDAAIHIMFSLVSKIVGFLVVHILQSLKMSVKAFFFVITVISFPHVFLQLNPNHVRESIFVIIVMSLPHVFLQLNRNREVSKEAFWELPALWFGS